MVTLQDAIKVCLPHASTNRYGPETLIGVTITSTGTVWATDRYSLARVAYEGPTPTEDVFVPTKMAREISTFKHPLLSVCPAPGHGGTLFSFQAPNKIGGPDHVSVPLGDQRVAITEQMVENILPGDRDRLSPQAPQDILVDPEYLARFAAVKKVFRCYSIRLEFYDRKFGDQQVIHKIGVGADGVPEFRGVVTAIRPSASE